MCWSSDWCADPVWLMSWSSMIDVLIQYDWCPDPVWLMCWSSVIGVLIQFDWCPDPVWLMSWSSVIVVLTYTFRPLLIGPIRRPLPLDLYILTSTYLTTTYWLLLSTQWPLQTSTYRPLHNGLYIMTTIWPLNIDLYIHTSTHWPIHTELYILTST